MDKKQREARRHQEDIALNRALLWVGGAIILEVLLLLVNRYYINFRVTETEVAVASFLSSALRVLRLAGTAAAVVCLIWAVLRFRKGGASGLPTVLALAFGAVAVCSHVAVSFQQSGMRMLFLLVPAWAGLALVYYLYHRDFFLSAAAVGMSILGLWFIRYGVSALPETVIILVGIVLVGAVALWLKKQGGVIHRADGSPVQILAKNAAYPVILVSCLASLAAVVVGLLASSTAYYLIFVMVAWLFALLVYYTVKLM